MSKKLKFVILVIIPLVFLVTGFSFDRTKYSTDPESAYLLNGLNIAIGRTVGHFDNPGTTVQVYSAVILRVTHLFRFSGTDIQTDVLLHSEFYIEVLRYSLIVMNALILFTLGYVALMLFGNFWLGLLLQISPFLSTNLIEELFTKVAPEPFLFATMAMMAMLLFRFYRYGDQPQHRNVYLFALLSGFGLATKMTFLPFTIIPFLILQGWKKKIFYLLLIIPAFVVFTLPAVKGYPHMFKWFLDLGTHTGTYGQGSKGIIDPAQYFASLGQIAANNKEMMIILLLGVGVFIYGWLKRKKSEERNFSRGALILFSLLLAVSGSILMVAKHYHNNHYLLPALSLLGTLLVFTGLELQSAVSAKFLTKLDHSLPFAIAIILITALLHIPNLGIAYNGYRDSNRETNEILSSLSRDYKGYAIAYYYPTSFDEYSSLRWGNIYSRQVHTEKLMQLFPQGLFYNAWDKTFQLWETSISPAELKARFGGKILLVGGPKNDEELKMVSDAGLRLKQLYAGRLQFIFEVDTAQSILLKGKTHASPPMVDIKNDFETISADKLWVMGDGQEFCKNASLTDGKPRSGKYSFSLPSRDCFALNYEIKNVKPGQEYEITIWRFASGDDASLVVSAASSDVFYAISKGYIEKDSNGWEKLSLSIKVPENFAETTLKAYLWNHGTGPAWFDDFELARYK